MKTKNNLREDLHRIDRKGYKAYKDIKGEYDFTEFILLIDYVQGDPFAAPSRVRVEVPQRLAGFPADTYSSASREVGLRDFLTRRFQESARKVSKGNRGSGQSGRIDIDRPGQEILERTSSFVNEETVEVRFTMGLPAFGRRIAGREAAAMLFEELPEIVRQSVYFDNLDSQSVYRHIKICEDADVLRSKLDSMSLAAFIADGAILPRRSGIDSRPLGRGKAIVFESPESMRVSVELPNSGAVTGMGIKKGITLIVGGGYHGKSTILNSIELGVYNHIPGDGRELVVSNPFSVKIRAEDGRRIEKVSIEPFINNLPLGEDTRAFSSENASGSTSQAANIIESLEAGAEVLLIDEDTSATNFMIRDHRMQELVHKDYEPITPFIDKARQLYNELGVSTILVIGGSGDYFDVADTVICMAEYKPLDFTENAKKLVEKYKAQRKQEGGKSFGKIVRRIPEEKSFDASKGKKRVKIKCRGRGVINFGREKIDLNCVEQLVDQSQTRAIADAIYYSKRYMNNSNNLREVINNVLNDIIEKGLDTVSPGQAGDYAQFRGLEFAAAINRLRSLMVTQQE